MNEGPARYCAKHQTWDNCGEPVEVVKKPGHPQSSKATGKTPPPAKPKKAVKGKR